MDYLVTIVLIWLVQLVYNFKSTHISCARITIVVLEWPSKAQKCPHTRNTSLQPCKDNFIHCKNMYCTNYKRVSQTSHKETFKPDTNKKRLTPQKRNSLLLHKIMHQQKKMESTFQKAKPHTPSLKIVQLYSHVGVDSFSCHGFCQFWNQYTAKHSDIVIAMGLHNLSFRYQTDSI